MAKMIISQLATAVLIFTPAESDYKQLRYGQNSNILVYHGIFGRLAGG